MSDANTEIARAQREFWEERLELKHLAPYLPYKLKAIDVFGDNQEIVGFSVRSGQYELMQYDEDRLEWVSTKMTNFKPILRPLNDLTNQIDYKSGTIIPILELANDNYYIKNNLAPKFDSFQKNNTSYFLAFNSQRDKSKYQYQLGKFDSDGGNDNLYFRYYDSKNRERQHYSDLKQIEMLFMWHFDVFGLIEKGLAIDMNTL